MNMIRVAAVVVMAVAVLSTGACEQLASLGIPSVKIAGDWYRMDGNFKDPDLYTFNEHIIRKNDFGWGEYRFRGASKLEVTAEGRSSVYTVEFPDDERMVWYTEVQGEKLKAVEWRR